MAAGKTPSRDLADTGGNTADFPPESGAEGGRETGDFGSDLPTPDPDATAGITPLPSDSGPDVPVPPPLVRPPGQEATISATGSGFGDESEGAIAPVEPEEADTPLAFAKGLLGRRVAGCLLQSLLGRGAMGLVFRARHFALDKEMAVKILNPALFYLKRHVDQFFQEARAAAALDHPNVVTVHGVGQDRGLYFLLMEIVEGESLADRIEREARISVPEVVRIGTEAALALGAAHEKGLVHRDIKPANLLLTRKGQVKVADFGLAGRFVAPEQASGQSEIMGTPYYIPPEQITGGAVDARADLYSLGVTLYYSVLGRRPFEGTTAREVFVMHLTRPPTPIREIDPAIPEELEAIVKKLLMKKPEARYPDAQSLIEDLARVPLAETP